MRKFMKRPEGIGVVLIVVVLLAFGLLFSKNKIQTWLMSGSTIQANFAQDYKLRPDISVVKVAYVPVGRVTGVTRNADGTASVSMKVSDSALKVLGSSPTATIRPTTVLGGVYFVDLEPGGDPGSFAPGSTIPIAHTYLPVELDKIADTLPSSARAGVQGTISGLNSALDASGTAALQRLMAQAPGALLPTSKVVKAALGTNPEQDLPNVVSGLEHTAHALTQQSGQLSSIVDNMATLSRALGDTSPQIGQALQAAPTALAQSAAGLASLNSTLLTLRATAANARPVAVKLNQFLGALDPVAVQARPVVNQLLPAIQDAVPSLRGLSPVLSGAATVFSNVQGPVLQRVNGPILAWLNSSYTGTGRYARSSTTMPMYTQIAGSLSGLARATGRMDGNGNAIGIQPGVGPGSVAGLPLSFEQLFNTLTAWMNRPAGTKLPAFTPSLTVQGLLHALKGGK
jgi:phospholipid/cholesterol/gamma-HCH transport system substrate-binding protein